MAGAVAEGSNPNPLVIIVPLAMIGGIIYFLKSGGVSTALSGAGGLVSDTTGAVGGVVKGVGSTLKTIVKAPGNVIRAIGRGARNLGDRWRAWRKRRRKARAKR